MEVAIFSRGILFISGPCISEAGCTCIVLFWEGGHFIWGRGVFYCRRGGPFLGGGVGVSWPATPPHGERQRSSDQLRLCTRSKVTDTVL